ncbi:MAG: CapA family protein [Clostridia bacterium]|nr:CapA family protein [Clostridia bacterium]
MRIALFVLPWLLLSACAAPQEATVVVSGTAEPVHELQFAVATQTPLPTPTPTPSPTALPEQTPTTVTIGAVGDITVDSRLLNIFHDEETGTYCFQPAYQGMQAIFDGVDLMCSNLETPIAGEAAGYTGNAQTPNAFEPGASQASYAFNAPDALAYDLKAVGFDFVSTANNHFGDRCFDGVMRTLDVLDQAELLHAGTYRSEEERAAPCVVEINGIQLGLLAASAVFNPLYDIKLRQTPYLIGNLNDTERIENDVRLCREAGAEFIVMFAHWDEEYASEPSRTTRRRAEWLLSIGVDAIIGSHPHVVQRFDYLQVDRDGTPYTGFVAYSLGNSLLRMTDGMRYAELFVRLTIEKDADGVVSLKEAAYLPVFSVTYSDAEQEYYEILPAYEDATRIPAAVPGNDKIASFAASVRKHVLNVCGTETVPVLPDPELPAS